MNRHELDYVQAREDRHRAKGDLIAMWDAEARARKVDAEAQRAGVYLDIIELDEIARLRVVDPGSLVLGSIADASIAMDMLARELEQATVVLLGLGCPREALEMSVDAYGLRCEAATLRREAGV